MSGLTAIIQHDDAPMALGEVLDCINPLQSFVCHEHRTDNSLLAVTYPRNVPAAASRSHVDGRYQCLLAGDVVHSGLMPWREIIRSVVDGEGDWTLLQGLQGTFLLVIYDTTGRKLWVITDSFGIQPIYFNKTSEGVVLSTAISTFLRLPYTKPEIDKRWIQEHLFFNYTVGKRTMLKGIRRLPAGVIYNFDAVSGQHETKSYVQLISSQLVERNQSSEIEDAVSLFSSVVPNWFPSDGRVTFGLSGGLDSRAVLAALPESICHGMKTFTYGIPGSTEIVEARVIAEAMGTDHQEIFLEENFLRKLPGYLYDTVYLSDGQQIINRSNLPFVYGSLGSVQDPVSAIVTGVSGDHLFRDHISAWGNVPYLISDDVAAMHRLGRQRLNREFYSDLFVADFSDVEQFLEATLDRLESEYGKFGDEEAYFRYLMYVAGPRYFGGQAAIANCYSTFRTPYWDRKLVQFAMDIKLGTVGLSKLLPRKDKYLETILQASVVARNKKLVKVPYLNLPINVFTKRSRTSYHFHRVARRARSVLYQRKRVKEENWPLWYQTILASEIRDLLGHDSRIKEYVTENFIDQQISDNNIHWLGKLITLEISLRLAENGWRREMM